MRKSILVLGLILIAGAASAQTKLSAKEQCGKPEPQYAVPVGDQQGHMAMMAQAKCTFPEGEIGGIKMESSQDTFWGDIQGATSSDRGYAVVAVAGGDKAFVRFEGKTTMKDGMPSEGKGTWVFLGGTGKLKGLKGKGTYAGKAGADGSFLNDIEGEYTIPAPAAKAPAKK
jgi:hypothetical protein